MTKRYALRFETGERAGETVPITGKSFTVGRRPGNSLQVVENSVSGKHAELVVDDRGLLVKDLGSTNGTRVGSDRILEMRVAPGAAISFGNVRLTLLEGDGDGPAATGPAPATRAVELDVTTIAAAPEIARGAVPPAESSQELKVSAEHLARAGKGGKLGGIVLVVLLGVVGGVWWWLQKSGSQTRSNAVREVAVVQGNLLGEGYSFEGDVGPWSAREGAPSSFIESARARFSGERGISVDLAAGEWALHQSQDVRATKELLCAAELRVAGDVAARLGIEFTQKAVEGESPLGPVTAWSLPQKDLAAFETVEVRSPVPAGYDRARAVVHASAAKDGEGGAVAADDVRLTPEGASRPALTFDAYQLFMLGEPARVGVLFKVDRVLVSGLEVRSAASAGRELATLVAEAAPNGIRFNAMERPGVATLALRAEAAAMRGGLATMGAGGHSAHGVAFERDGVTDLLVGGGLDLVRLRFDAPVTVKGRPAGPAFQITVELGPLTEFLVQLEFREERAAAVKLAAAARDAEQQGDLGKCLRLWRELLDNHPYESDNVAAAEETTGRLTQRGLEEVRGVAQEVERAQFFRLVDLFRQCRDSAEGIAKRYAGSDVEAAARDLEAEIAREIEALEADLDRHEAARLQSILAALEASGAAGLAGEVRTYLEEKFGGAQ